MPPEPAEARRRLNLESISQPPRRSTRWRNCDFSRQNTGICGFWATTSAAGYPADGTAKSATAFIRWRDL